MQFTSSKRILPLAALVVATAALATGCTGNGASPDAGSDGPLLVWTDSTRQAAFEAYEAANPHVDLEIEVVDPTSLLSKIQLANRVGSGWPDVIFDPTPNDVASLAGPLFDYAQPLNDLIDEEVQDGFSTKNAACTIEGELYCLQNDLAQTVLWYNKPLMEEFGYEVPTTWDEYRELGERVAEEHPGYVIGAVGAQNIWYDFLWSSGCPLATAESSAEVQIDTESENCTRVADVLDPLLENGSVSRLSPFDPGMSAIAKEGKLLMLPGPSWFGEYVLKPESSYAIPAGQIAAGAMPTWADGEENYSGAFGGGIYVVSSHAADPQAAADVIEWVSTATEYQQTAPTYPAYAPAAGEWVKTLAEGGYYAEDPTAVLEEAAGKINPVVSPVRYQIEPSVNATVVAAIKSGGTIAEALLELQTQLASLAQTAGYAVVQ